MTRSEIIEQLKQIFSFVVGEDKIDLNSLTEEANLYTDLNLTSIGMLYMVIAIEETFNVKFTQVFLADFNTVKDVVDYIESKIEK